MLKNLFNRRQSQAHVMTLTDRRSGPPDRRQPDPMPRMRWYS